MLKNDTYYRVLHSTSHRSMNVLTDMVIVPHINTNGDISDNTSYLMFAESKKDAIENMIRNIFPSHFMMRIHHGIMRAIIRENRYRLNELINDQNSLTCQIGNLNIYGRIDTTLDDYIFMN